MLETLAIAALAAVGVSLSVNFLWGWSVGTRVRHLELDLADLQDQLLREVKRRAANASVEARATRATVSENAAIKAATGEDLGDEPWWSGIVKGK